MWWKRRKIRGLIAASLYESLSDEERQELEQALAASADLRREAGELHDLAVSIPKDRPELDIDLVPLLHARLSEEASPVNGNSRLVWAAAFAVVMIVGAALVFQTNFGNSAVPGPNSSPISEGPPSLLAQAIHEAELLVAEREPARAYDLLRKGVEGQPNDPLVPDAQLRIADLAFELGRYGEALTTYDLVVAMLYRNRGDKSAQHRVVQRRELLAEAAKDNFAPLHAVSIAMRDRGNELAGLEQVIADTPGTFVAELAAESMGYTVMREVEAGDVKTAYLTGMETARARCTNPHAVALLDLKIGDLYRDDFQDFAAAERHYRKAELSQTPVVAKRATDALDSLAAND
jgi:tetratricopeptide (TPR) repeat protein